jgi:hypothetical protein
MKRRMMQTNHHHRHVDTPIPASFSSSSSHLPEFTSDIVLWSNETTPDPVRNLSLTNRDFWDAAASTSSSSQYDYVRMRT